VGGLVTAVRDGFSGLLVKSHDPVDWAGSIGDLLSAPAERARLAAGAVEHARHFSWNRTAAGLLAVYREAVTSHRDARAELLDGVC
jgi:D-inositol-3-phosphate glycosyltransferase